MFSSPSLYPILITSRDDLKFPFLFFYAAETTFHSCGRSGLKTCINQRFSAAPGYRIGGYTTYGMISSFPCFAQFLGTRLDGMASAWDA